MTKRHTILISLAALAALALVAAAGTYLYLVPSGVQTIHPHRGPAVEAVYATGIVEPVTATDVAPAVPGHLMALNVAEGAKITKGDVLAKLDDRKERARVTELETKVKYFTSEAARFTTLLKSRTVSIVARNRIVFQRDAAKNELETARAKLADHVLRAPISGVVLRRDGNIGDMIPAGRVIFKIGKLTKLRISADVDEADILRIALRQRAMIRSDALADKILSGTVTEKTPLGDPIARSYRVRIALPPKTPLLVGMTVEVNIIVREDKNALLLPEAALDGSTVWLVRGGRVHRKSIKTGVSGNGKVEILSGLKETDIVVLKRPKRLREGMKLRNIKLD